MVVGSRLAKQSGEQAEPVVLTMHSWRVEDKAGYEKIIQAFDTLLRRALVYRLSMKYPLILPQLPPVAGRW